MLTRDDPKAGDRQVESLGQPAQGFEPLRLVDRVAVVEVDDGRGLGRHAPDCSSTDDESAHALSSLHRRHAEVRCRFHAFAPARGHGLDAGVKAHALGPVLVHVSENRILPAAEAVE